MKFFLVAFLALSAAWGLEPFASISFGGGVQDFCITGGKIYAGLDSGAVEVRDLSSGKKTGEISIPRIVDFAGESVEPKVYSVDCAAKKLLIVAQGQNGYSAVYFYDKTLKRLDLAPSLVKKARFLDENRAILATLDSTLTILDLGSGRVKAQKQIGQSSFGDFALSDDKKQIVIANEAGAVKIFDEHLRLLEDKKPLNLDRVYSIDYKRGVVLTAGQDRKAVLYSKGAAHAMSFDFLLFACALSPSGALAAVAHNDKNEILIFDAATKKRRAILKGQTSTITKILFLGESTVIASGDCEFVKIWKLK